METKPILAITLIAAIAIAGMIIFVNSETTGMLSGQQRIPYAYVYGKQANTNLCVFMKCPNGATGMPLGIERYTNRVYCACPKEPIPYYEMPGYVTVGEPQ
ncbi:hypothetical protein KY310_04080 [Candidatus Woesearchaeota archaeon]|nr:hypothetical protein [Candidatus Woesearchaeota archaeon]